VIEVCREGNRLVRVLLAISHDELTFWEFKGIMMIMYGPGHGFYCGWGQHTIAKQIQMAG
jgi:hypothetical protein